MKETQAHEEYLKNLISSYKENKTLADRYKKLCDAENKAIKEELTNANLTEFSTDDCSVKLITATTESMNEEKLLEFAHQHGLEIIQTKEFIDYDTLEKLIYDGIISQDLLLEIDSFRTKKETIQLRITAKKK